MGVVSGAVLNAGGKVTGIVPYAMVAAGGEGKAADPVEVVLEPNTEQVRQSSSILNSRMTNESDITLTV